MGMGMGFCCCGDDSEPASSAHNFCNYFINLPLTLTISESTTNVAGRCADNENGSLDLYGTYSLPNYCFSTGNDAIVMWSSVISLTASQQWKCPGDVGYPAYTKTVSKQARVTINCSGAPPAACPEPKITWSAQIIFYQSGDATITNCTNANSGTWTALSSCQLWPTARCRQEFAGGIQCVSSISPFFAQSSEFVRDPADVSDPLLMYFTATLS